MTNEIVLRREFAPIVIPAAQEMIDAIADDLADAADLDVCSDAMAEEATGIISRIAGVIDKLDAQRLTLTAPLREGQKWVNDGFNGTIESLNEVVTDTKEKLKGWNKVLAERKRLKDIEDAKARKEAADKLQAEADKKAKEAQDLLDKAKALEATNPEQAAQLFEQAGEVMDGARDVQADAQQALVQRGGSGSAKSVKGTSQTWKARIINKQAFVLAAANRPEFISMVDIDETKLNALARASAGAVPPPGIEYYQDEQIRTRR